MAMAAALAGATSAMAGTALCEKKATPACGIPGTTFERTLILVKPEGVARGLIHDIIGRWERRGFQLVGCKLMSPSLDLVERHYAYMSERPFFSSLTQHIAGSGPVLAMVWQGRDVVKTSRLMIGSTNPLVSAPGTVRGDLAVHVGRNVIHASDGISGAAAEIPLWFTESEIQNVDATATPWLYDEREIENNRKRDATGHH